MEKYLNIWKFLKNRFQFFKQKTALVCGSERISYAQLTEIVEQGGKQRKILPVLEGSLAEQAISILKGLRRENIVVPLNKAYGENYCQNIFSELEKHNANDMDSDIALILFTSGSTGKPKGAMLSHENVISNLRAIGGYFEIDETDKMLIARPLMHCAVLTGEFLYGLYKGAEIHLYGESFMPRRIVRYIAAQGITVFGATPTLLHLLLPSFLNEDARVLQKIVVSGEILSAAHAERFAAAFPEADIYSVYGLTEASPRVAALPPKMFASKYGSIGKPIESVELRLEGERQCEGRLFVRSPGIMRGYLGNESLTKQKIVGGWLDTGDIARRDADGYYYILGRADGMIIRSGINIYPEEMEALLKQDERVRECLFYSENDGALGKRLCVKMAAEITKEEAFEICAAKLPSFARPQKIEIVGSLLKTASGKVRRSV